MKKQILEKLREAEFNYKISILFAVESGSRAWGFPSPDSDYDVRFIYKRNLKDYLRISHVSDFIDVECNAIYDIKGWDIEKALYLTRQSNASLYEYLQSPIHYIHHPDFENELKALIWAQFQPQKLTAHYLGITKKRLMALEGNDTMPLKSLFYALRSVLAALWIQTNQTVPTMAFQALSVLIPNEINIRIEELITLKATVGEKYCVEYDEVIMHWIKTTYDTLKLTYKNLHISTVDTDALDDFFYQTITHEINDKRFKGEAPHLTGMH
ncbi:nucleotidyltransferase domain-containing protein [Faecalibacter rhinopitheci]|uniref:Nucleotidyltransferase domain-containing protein n=1 Tax=Faecalibacter rhinopitheci TaxID=2779678 RepID=A0A8J7FTX6_9FLAO|nr:nucleotidyltransferase domain-containing protein [Faecalibacter rhinopitheci]MBF0596336.1 nucleotidyltransferase domain-containing protein [Faecalibacter rhinopitheci]